MIVVRVYGILINEDRQVLVSDELIRGNYFTKFCGGGLEKGEGTVECLKREFNEEMGIEIDVTGHLYTTDFYQQSAFNPEHQILSIYYAVQPLGEISTLLKKKPFDFNEAQMILYDQTGSAESFRLINWENFSEECMTLPIDKVVARMLKEGKF